MTTIQTANPMQTYKALESFIGMKDVTLTTIVDGMTVKVTGKLTAVLLDNSGKYRGNCVFLRPDGVDSALPSEYYPMSAITEVRLSDLA